MGGPLWQGIQRQHALTAHWAWYAVFSRLLIEHGYRVDNPAKFVDRRRVKPKELHLPSQAQFHEMANHIETSGAGQAKDCANLFRFLAFSGLRIDEARHVVWNDMDFEKGVLHVRITKNGKDRWIPLNSSLRQLLEKMNAERTRRNRLIKP